jgi:hypothetical protein
MTDVEAELCQCPRCGRMHKSLGFGTPPDAPRMIRIAFQEKDLRDLLTGRVVTSTIGDTQIDIALSDIGFDRIMLAALDAEP